MLRQCCRHGFTGSAQTTWMKRRHHCWRVLPLHFDGLNVGSDSHLHLLSEWIPQLLASFHLSLARICRVIGGITIDAYMQWTTLGKLLVRVGLWCLDLPKIHRGLWLRLLRRIYAGFFLLHIILGLNHSGPQRMTLQWSGSPMPSLPVNIAVAVGLKSKGGRW